jgi:hypothetical protein
MGKARTAREDAQDFDPNVDRYPDFRECLRRIMAAEDLPKGPIERLELTTLASGEATYRVWQPRALEPEGGYLPKA